MNSLCETRRLELLLCGLCVKALLCDAANPPGGGRTADPPRSNPPFKCHRPGEEREPPPADREARALRGSRSASVLKASFVATRHDVALLSQEPLHTLRQDRHARHVSPTDTAQQEHTNETTMRFVVCPNRQRSRLRRSYPWFSSIKHRLTFRPRSTMSSRVAVSPQRTAGASPARHPRSAPASPAAPRTGTRPVAPTKAGIPDFSCHHAPGHGWRPFAAMPAGLASA